MAAHQAPLSLGFSRQEHWSGLPFPSPMHESEKWKWGRSVLSDSSQPHGLQPTRLFPSMGFPRQEHSLLVLFKSTLILSMMIQWQARRSVIWKSLYFKKKILLNVQFSYTIRHFRGSLWKSIIPLGSVKSKLVNLQLKVQSIKTLHHNQVV